MSANEGCRHRSMHCACCPEATPPAPSVSVLLGPGIRRVLQRYSSVKKIECYDDPFTRELVVTYWLIDGSINVRRVPFLWYVGERYSHILDHITKELGKMP